ncbi:acyl-CoA dehydratase activase-related protein [Candidatus Soleaferrea massiliensis]|uniref:acyl-CoA dehydratase activase-related protein n=1 Tax=Candidatus Soleaferrea massiliensis TaxID=1470354 RepID=UPI0006943059|nr:acyl-CoA dehydratase activase-related protein [Candidatus Soleaferrea massiliensis]
MNHTGSYLVGIDIGSTTVKVVVLDENKHLLFKQYERHHSKVREKTLEILRQTEELLKNRPFRVSISGSAGLGVSQSAKIQFVQEVFATKIACDRLLRDIDVVVELGGEDAKILFLTGGNEERMNGSCAGGTGAFIDQMASLLSMTVEELDNLSFSHKQIYNIASRCGVFAKSDIQPLLNQGANKADIAASIYQAIVNQTIAGLAQGREIKGKVAFLGGPLTFLYGLRQRFVEVLRLDEKHAVFPENAQFFVAIGAALDSMRDEATTYEDLIGRLLHAESHSGSISTLPPLFETQQDYDDFTARHHENHVETVDISAYSGGAYLGIDAGSTTTKIALITEEGELLFSYYASNFGQPLEVVKEQLGKLLALCGERITIKGSAVTGYGEELLKNAYHIDIGIVETTAHYYAARHFNPDVDFILDIGGQDMKCFKLKNGIVDSIMLNEACSSGCGSFIETFAVALGYGIADFAKLGLFAKNPVNLGSRCTVFMNSSVKQAQKDGAGVDDISAGLAISVIKNAVYKVIRARSIEELGEHIVVQGGTFLNDAILRAFELEIGKDVTRPTIAGLMGAYGAALYAREAGLERSALISAEELERFTHTSKMAECGLCTNHCKLTINTFNGKHKFITGNRCERPTGKAGKEQLPNAYTYKLEKLLSYQPVKGKRGRIGLPLGLNMYENLPFWYTLFTTLGFEVETSGISSRNMYVKGQHTIPSDTVCYPAKMLHGHIEELLEKGIQTIFYPCMPYNFNEETGDNHYNCPVVAYYPELLSANITALKDVRFLNPYFAPHARKAFTKKIGQYLLEQFGIPVKETRAAVDNAYDAFVAYKEDIFRFGDQALQYAKEHGKEVIILAGRPYHVDPEINHGIDKLITSLGLVVISEDCIDFAGHRKKVDVLNQWTYHSRLYNAAEYVTQHEHIHLVQLVSFGCGLDAITTDEVKNILESGSRFYTQIKIDEINNLGATKIRLRSLVEAIHTTQEQKDRVSVQ